MFSHTLFCGLMMWNLETFLYNSKALISTHIFLIFFFITITAQIFCP
uniref:Uncharacterized protein n=1 Tax=Rhizophora mucronata TaxID=61149 RepID=A0A2P2QN80_RHIMU